MGDLGQRQNENDPVIFRLDCEVNGREDPELVQISIVLIGTFGCVGLSDFGGQLTQNDRLLRGGYVSKDR